MISPALLFHVIGMERVMELVMELAPLSGFESLETPTWRGGLRCRRWWITRS